MTNQEIDSLVAQYFDAEGYQFPGHFEHRLDPDSSAAMYSIIRDFKPHSCLEIGSWEGGSSCIIAAALKKNTKPFTYVISELDGLREKTYEHVVSHTGVTPQMIGDITKNLENVPEKLDFLFVDTDHDLATTEWIVKNIFPRVKKGGLLVMHDWAVTDVDGVWKGKGENGVGGWPETQYLMDLHAEGRFPFEKVYWNYGNPYRGGQNTNWETGFFRKV